MRQVICIGASTIQSWAKMVFKLGQSKEYLLISTAYKYNTEGILTLCLYNEVSLKLFKEKTLMLNYFEQGLIVLEPNLHTTEMKRVF